MSEQDECRHSPWYFATKYVKTRDPQASDPVRRFPAYDYLQVFFRRAQEHLLLGVEKSRQLLLSWSAVVHALWSCVWQAHRHWMIQSQKEDKAKALRARADFILQHLPEGLLECTWKSKSDRIEFSNGSILHCVPQGPSQIASYNPTGVIVDEMALQDDAQAAYETMLPALRAGGQLIGISTPRGESFFSEFMGIPAVRKLRMHYTMHPVYAKEAAELGGWDIWKKQMKEEWGYDDPTWSREMEIDYDVLGGIPAFKPPFAVETHVSDTHIQPNPASPIQRGWDLGFHRPACVWTQIAANGQWVILRELLGKDIQLIDFIQDVVRMSREIAPQADHNTFQDFIDPSGYNKKDVGPSSAELLWDQGIFPVNDSRKVALRPSIRLIKQNLRIAKFVNADTGVTEMRPSTLVDPRCEELIRGLNGAYGTSDVSSDKFVGGRSAHLVDALRYIAASTFSLGDQKVKKTHERKDYRFTTIGQRW